MYKSGDGGDGGDIICIPSKDALEEYPVTVALKIIDL
jgi:hypothetical protein